MIIKFEEVKHSDISPGVHRVHYLDRDTGAGCVSMGTMELAPHTGLAMHRHLVEDAMYVIEGTGTLVVDGEESTVSAGMVLLIPAGHAHCIRNDSEQVFKVVYTYPAVNVERILEH